MSVFVVVGVETGNTRAKEIARTEEKQLKQLKRNLAYMKKKQEVKLQRIMIKK
jgi:hypothetical protein